ncbi:MAG: V-type ATP synthase subunit K [Oscillospiraceae bacterium]|nr:V-type ATP synthase subunit K [Oscillospiraceae bacterium]
MNYGLLLAFLGVVMSIVVTAVGSARGVGMASEAAAAVVADDPSKFGRLLILQLLPGTQGLYGFIISIMVMTNIGILGGEPPKDIWTGLLFFVACLSVSIGGFFSAILQSRVCISGVNIIAKKPAESAKAIVSGSLVELYALISFIVSLLLVTNVNNVVAML